LKGVMKKYVNFFVGFGYYYTSIIAILFLTILEKTRLNVNREIR